LFLFYINNIPLKIQGVKLVLFADDTNILVVDRNKDPLQQPISCVMNMSSKKNSL